MSRNGFDAECRKCNLQWHTEGDMRCPMCGFNNAQPPWLDNEEQRVPSKEVK